MQGLCRIAALMIVSCVPVSTVTAEDAVFQYTATTPAKKGMTTTYLWVPPHAKTIRGVVIGGMTLARDATIRKACADEQLAVVFVKSGLASFDVRSLLDELAKTSGYRDRPRGRIGRQGIESLLG